MKRFVFLIISINYCIVASGQNKSDSLKNFLWGDRVSIYEYGTSLSSCETNFKNLLNNWHPDLVTNADEYDTLYYSFYETIADSARYNYYRNYFTSGEAVGSNITTQGRIVNGRESNELYIKPGYYHSGFYDLNELPKNSREIFSEEFARQAQELLIREFNIDTIDIEYAFYEMDSTIFNNDVWGGYSSQYIHHKYHLASTEPISKNYIDIHVKKEKSFDDLSIEEKRAFLLEELLIERIGLQVMFNQVAQIGDKVYIVTFRYSGKPYQVYVVCNPESKQVVWDNFFNKIYIDTKNH